MVTPQIELTISRSGTVLARHILAPGEYILGRSHADIAVEDDGVSVPHARLTLNYYEAFIEDLGSAHGTFLAGQRVEDCTRIHQTQRVQLGRGVTLALRRLKALDGGDETLAPQAALLEQILPPEILHERKYECGPVVAEGGMGAILTARELPLRRTVAMKVLVRGDAEKDFLRFIEEAQVTGQLEHPNIVPVHELSVGENAQLFYTMKYVRGDTLKKVLAELGEADPPGASSPSLAHLLTVFQKICDAVSFAHSKSVVHRDLKPENVMLAPFGEVLVMDWGLAKIMSDSPVGAATPAAPALLERSVVTSSRNEGHSSVTLAGTLLGTPRYMAPEQARGELEIDHRSDIYALGAILYQILTLRPPVSGASVEEVLEKVRTGRIDPIHPPTAAATAARDRRRLVHLPGQRIPESLAAVAMQALSLEPSRRYQSVAELQAEITAFQGGFATQAEHATPFKQLSLAVGRYRREALVVVAALLVLAAMAVAAFVRVAAERDMARRERTRSEQALADLRSTAPAFAAQARSFAAQERFAEAVEKLDYALRLEPTSAPYQLFKADLLESQLRFPAAAEAYRLAARLGPAAARAVRHVALCEALARASAVDGKIPSAPLAALFSAMLEEQRPAAEMMPIARLLGQERQLALTAWRERLRALPLPPERSLEARLTAREDGLLSLDLSGSFVSDLSVLAGMPLGELHLTGCIGVQSLESLRGMPLRILDLAGSGVTDLSPLAGAPLERLVLKNTRVSDLRPLAGRPLRQLDCAHIPAVDFTPLAGAPIETLDLSGTRVSDLAVLRSLPLRTLSLEGCTEIRNLDLLAGLGALESLILPHALSELSARDLEAVLGLRRHPRLRQLTSTPLTGMQLSATEATEVFWKQWEPVLRWLIPLRRAAPAATAQRLPDGTWEVNLREQPVSDVAFLEGAPISKLVLFNVPVSDLRPVAALPLRVLDLRLSSVIDLRPIAGLPLRELYLWRTRVTDFSPVSTLVELELLDCGETAIADLSVLVPCRRLKALRMGNSRVTDLSPLAGLPLEKLHCDSVAVPDLRPLLGCPTLRWLIPPRAARNVEVVRALPRLERISYRFLQQSEPEQTAAEFWQEWDRERGTTKK